MDTYPPAAPLPGLAGSGGDDPALDEMFDMTSLSMRRTGLPGMVSLSTMQGQHGPRIKWFPGRPGRDVPCLIITLEDPPRAINQGLPPRVARDGAAALDWAARNRDALLRYWHDGLSWDEDEFAAFIDGLAKLP